MWYYNITIGVSIGYFENTMESRLERVRKVFLYVRYGKNSIRKQEENNKLLAKKEK